MTFNASDAHSIETLAAVATAAREAMEACGPESGDPWLKSFPHNACGHTCHLLGRYFVEVLGVNARYVGAEQGERTHAWLAVGDIIVDITADQFGQPPVIVSRESAWHAQWNAEEGEPPICSQEQWPMYPLATWQAFVQGMNARVLPSFAFCS